MSDNQTVLYGSDLANLAHWESPPPLNMTLEVVKTRAKAICTGLKFNEEQKSREEKWQERRNNQCATVLHMSTAGMSGIQPSNHVLVTPTKWRTLF